MISPEESRRFADVIYSETFVKKYATQMVDFIEAITKYQTYDKLPREWKKVIKECEEKK